MQAFPLEVEPVGGEALVEFESVARAVVVAIFVRILYITGAEFVSFVRLLTRLRKWNKHA